MGVNEIYSKVYVFANTMQIIELEIKPGDTLVADAELKYWIDEGITFETKSCDSGQEETGAFGKFLKRDKRKSEGDSRFINYFKNSGKGKKRLAFAAPELREILPIDISEKDGDFLCHKNAFVCASGDIKVCMDRMNRGFNLRNHVLAKKGFVLLRLAGHGKVFVHAGGRCAKKPLKNQEFRTDKRCIVGFTDGIRCDAESSGIFKSLQPVINGSYETTLKGTGAVYLQSKPHIRQRQSSWLTRDLWEFVDPKSLQPYMNNLQKITNMQWSKFRSNLKMNQTKDSQPTIDK